MTTLREAAQQALEYLEAPSEKLWPAGTQDRIITALRAALAEPVRATWCDIHQHHKWCEHNGGVMGSTGWGNP